MRSMFTFLVGFNFKDAIQANGVIERVKTTESGNSVFEAVFINQAGMQMLGKSISYVSTKQRYEPGDEVELKYFINRQGKAFFKIIDEDLDEGDAHVDFYVKVAMGISIVSGILAVVFFIKNIIL